MSGYRCRTTGPAERRATVPEASTGGHAARDDRVASGPGGGLARFGQVLLELQVRYGNRYVQQLVSQAPGAPAVQAKLLLGPPGDRYEQEAERAAAGNVPPRAARPAGSPAGARLSRTVEQAVQRARGGGGRPLPAPVRESMEQAFGTDFAGVRAHTDAEADTLNRALGARAFTAGQDIFFRRGNYDPAGRAGQRLLAHELTHVVQQDAGPAVIQRYLFSNYTIPNSVAAFKTAYGPARGPMALVFQSLDHYVAQHPQQPAGVPVDLPAMTPAQLRLARDLLLNLQETIDGTLKEWGPTLDATQTEGAARLRVLAQNELGKVVGRQAAAGEFARPPGYQPPARQQLRHDVASFTGWLTTHPVYRKWEHQGAGRCEPACREILTMLRAEVFTGDRATRVKVRGIKVASPLPDTGPANHFVLVARVGGQRLVIDATMGQFLGGHPVVEPEAAWKERFRTSKVAFTNDEYLKPASVNSQDFDTVAQAVAFAPLHG